MTRSFFVIGSTSISSGKIIFLGVLCLSLSFLRSKEYHLGGVSGLGATELAEVGLTLFSEEFPVCPLVTATVIWEGRAKIGFDCGIRLGFPDVKKEGWEAADKKDGAGTAGGIYGGTPKSSSSPSSRAINIIFSISCNCFFNFSSSNSFSLSLPSSLLYKIHQIWYE